VIDEQDPAVVHVDDREVRDQVLGRNVGLAGPVDLVGGAHPRERVRPVLGLELVEGIDGADGAFESRAQRSAIGHVGSSAYGDDCQILLVL
jgi:hypothetical protein